MGRLMAGLVRLVVRLLAACLDGFHISSEGRIAARELQVNQRVQ